MRVKEVCGKGIKAQPNQLYQLKETSGRLCARKNHYTEAEIANINSQCRDFMHFWGFASHPTKESPLVGLAEYKDQTEDELNKHGSYEKLNKSTIEQAVS